MSEKLKMPWQVKKLSPFGLSVKSKINGNDLRTIPISFLKEWIDINRVVALRGFKSLEGDAMPEFCKMLGELLMWNFGAVNNLRVDKEAKNYLYTNHAVPFHWDGAFVGRIPHYIFFHCDKAPQESDGETLFCDTTLVLKHAPVEKRKLWEHISITYTTEKIVHYGGEFTSPLICTNPVSGESILRFAEAVEDLNPVHLKIKGIAEDEQNIFLKDMHERLNNENVCYSHRWQDGDVVIADNHTLLHGRKAFRQATKRHIRRVNIL